MSNRFKKLFIVLALICLPHFMPAQQIESIHWCTYQIKEGDKVNNTPPHVELFLNSQSKTCFWQGQTRKYELSKVGIDNAQQLVLFKEDKINVFCKMSVKIEGNNKKNETLKLVFNRPVDGDIQYYFKLCSHKKTE